MPDGETHQPRQASVVGKIIRLPVRMGVTLPHVSCLSPRNTTSFCDIMDGRRVSLLNQSHVMAQNVFPM
jgi:hypothetical protein